MIAVGRAAPLRFLVVVIAGWVTARGLVVEGWRPGAAPVLVSGPPRCAQCLRPKRGGDRPASPLAAPHRAEIAGPAASDRSRLARLQAPAPAAGERLGSPGSARAIVPTLLARTEGARAGPGGGAAASADPRVIAASANAKPLATPAAASLPASASRLSGSAWAFVRGGGRARPLAPVGQIGGGQAGARVLYRFAGTLAAAARVSRTIGGPDQTEAALGLDWRPVASLPVHLTVERRIAIDRGGRNAWSLGAAGGAYAVPLAPGWRLDGYAEAGVVGARARDLYGDGAVRAGRELKLGGGAGLTLGAGLWGAAQPHAERLDGGPTAVLRVPVSGRTLSAALDWRARLAGGARPHSGAALTVGVDF